MIEINLLGKKKKLKAPTILGVDLANLNFKMIIVAVLILYIPEGFIVDHFEEEGRVVNEELAVLNTKQRKLRKELAGNKNVKEKLKIFNKQIRKLEKRSEQVDKIIKERTNPKNLLEKLARSAPKDLWFNKLAITDTKKITINGGANNYRSIGDFITAANESAYFSNTMTLKDSKTETEKMGGRDIRIESFEIQGTVKVFNPFN